MKIREVKSLVCQGGIRNWIFTKVTTDEGLVGWGEATDWVGENEIAATADFIGKRFLIGEDPRNIERLWYKMYMAIQGGGRDLSCAITGIETALWDILGKTAKMPLYQLLGGCCYDKLRLYSHCDGGAEFEEGKSRAEMEADREEDVVKRANQIVRDGFTGMKTHMSAKDGSWGGYPKVRQNRTIDDRTVRNTVEKIRVMRETVGPDVAIMLDVNNLLNVPSAIKLGRALEPFNLLFYEDVVRQDEGMLDVRKVKAAVKIPISSGENLYNVWQFREALELDAIDVVELDCAHCGGIAQSKKIVALAEAYHKPISPHNPNGPLATIQTAHICASTPNFLILEIIWPDVPWVNDVLSEPLKVRNGCLELPTKPGLGVEINEDEVKRHPPKPGLLDKCIVN